MKKAKMLLFPLGGAFRFGHLGSTFQRIRTRPWTPTAVDASASGPQPVLSALDDHIAFEFGDRCHHSEEEPPMGVVVSIASPREMKPTPISSNICEAP